MKHFFLLMLTFLSTYLIGQEQITNIVSSGFPERYILRKHNDDNYILTTLPSDSLKVYKLIDGIATFQYSRKFDGIYAIYSYIATDQFLLMSDVNGSIAYNFTNNTILKIPYEGSLEYTSWYIRQSLGDEIILRQSTKDFTVSKQFLYNLSTGQFKELRSDLNFLKLGEEKLYGYMYSSDTSYQVYVLDKTTLVSIDSTNTPILYGNQYFFDGENFLVYTGNNEVKRYNFTNSKHELIRKISQPYHLITLSQSNDQYVIDVDYFDDHTMIRIHSGTLQSSQFVITDEYANAKPDILYGKYLILDSKFVVIDTASGMKSNIYSSTGKNGFTILENRYIIYDFNKEHLMLDLATMQKYSLALSPSNFNVRNVEVIFSNGVYLVNLDNASGNNKKLLEVNTNTKTGAYSTKITKSNEGLIKSSKLIKVKDDLILVNDENIYLVNGNKAIKLSSKTPYPFRYSPYKIDDDVFYWCESANAKFNIYKVENGQAVSIAALPNLIGSLPDGVIYLQDIFVTPDAIFFSGNISGSKQYRYDLQTHQTSEVSNVKNRNYYGIYHNGAYYYSDISKIVMLKADGSLKDLNLNYDHGHQNPFISYKDRLFIENQEGLLEIVDDKLEVRIKNENEFGIRISLIEGLIILTDYPDDYLYDGTATYKITGNVDQFRSFRILDDYFVIYDGIATNTTIASFLNFKTNTTISLPTEVARLKNIRLFRNGEKYVILGSGGFSPYHKIELYETDENFSFFANVQEFNVTGNGVISSFTEYINEGFLHAGNTMYLMDTLFNFVPIDGLTGENQTNAVSEQDGYFYFIAIHPINGRQLFRIQPFSLRTSVEDGTNIFSKVNIYPNPASQEIFFEGESLQTVEIYNFNGLLVQKSTIGDNNILEINDLNNGVYVVILTSSSGAKSVGKFIKVN